MVDIEHEGIYITPEGYFKTEWNSKKRKFESYSLKHDDIVLKLNEQVYLSDNVRLKDVFIPLMKEELFSIIFYTDWWKDLMIEINSKEWKPWIGDQKLKKDIDGEEIEYLEIYKVIEFSQKRNTLYASSLWHFHGIGYPFTDANNAKNHYLNVGDHVSYAMEFTSMADLMNTPLRIGSVDLFNEDELENNKRKLLHSTENSLTLYELIRSIVYEMSFCGVGESKEEFKENLNSSFEEVKEDPQSLTYGSVQIEDFFEEIKLQGQEEQSLKAIDKISYIFSEIENVELLNKMKDLLKHKLDI